MKKHALPACAAAIVCAVASSARAGSSIGAPIIVPTDNVLVTLEFVSYEAAYTGELSFLGVGTADAVTVPASDTGLPGLGQQTFVNKTATTGSPVQLQGVFNAGDVIHFAYRVYDPAPAADLLRTDDLAAQEQFSWDSALGRLHVEDLRPTDPWYDADYNDIIVQITFTPIPGPASASLLALAVCAGMRRRRRG